jgi:hypothetical protein
VLELIRYLALYANKSQLQRAFSRLDINNSGKLQFDEFKETFEAMNFKYFESPLTSMQLKQLYKSIGKNDDGTVNYVEFLNSFKIVDTAEGKDKVDMVSHNCLNFLTIFRILKRRSQNPQICRKLRLGKRETV